MVSTAPSNIIQPSPYDFTIHHGPDVFEKEGLPEVSWLVKPLIPASGRTILHGPTSAGKSALVWALGNAIQTGRPVFSMEVRQANVLFVSLDMADIPLRIRWFGSKDNPKPKEDRFYPKFDYITPQMLPILERDPKGNWWIDSPKGKEFRSLLGLYQFVIFDALGAMVGNTNDPETATIAHQIFKRIMGNTPYILIHHDRQEIIGPSGFARKASNDDASGTRRWLDFSQHQLHLYKKNETIRFLEQGKSQVAADRDDPWKFYISEVGKAELYDEHKAKELEVKIAKALKGKEFTTKMQAYGIVKAHYGHGSTTTARNWVKQTDWWENHPLGGKDPLDVLATG
ncbi:MAG: AAA family ATPase [Nitrososphaerales archaeon]